MEQIYSGDVEGVRWSGHRAAFADFSDEQVASVVERIYDLATADALEEELRALAQTDAQVGFIESVLSSTPEPLPWQIGESLAESLLAFGHGAVWPWNGARDLRTPRASLPGADLVGFSIEIDDAVFLFGEVKTSSDIAAPPGVMSGRSGMVHQLESLDSRVDIQFALINWLRARCLGTEHDAHFQAALARYVASQGREVSLVGCLMRDTEPDSLDLQNRATALSQALVSPGVARLFAWYFDKRCIEWPNWASASR